MQLLKIPNDDKTLDRIQIQKASTPVPGRCQNNDDANRIFDVISPNAVVCERSCEDGVDVVAQRASALQDIGLRLEKQRAETTESEKITSGKRLNWKQKLPNSAHEPKKVCISTGSTMVDQFKPWYYGVAFAFVFSFCTGMPDFAAFQEQERYRRKESAPRVEQADWDKIMSRRIEGQLVYTIVPEFCFCFDVFNLQNGLYVLTVRMEIL